MLRRESCPLHALWVCSSALLIFLEGLNYSLCSLAKVQKLAHFHQVASSCIFYGEVFSIRLNTFSYYSYMFQHPSIRLSVLPVNPFVSSLVCPFFCLHFHLFVQMKLRYSSNHTKTWAYNDLRWKNCFLRSCLCTTRLNYFFLI